MIKERLHFIGIGGIGMSALAQIVLARGAAVSGSDIQESEITARLSDLGAAVTIGHTAASVDGSTRVIVSDAIDEGNPELLRARELGIPIQRRSQLLAELMSLHRGIAVAGTHGKTTVTAMIGLVLVEAGLDPTIELGGEYAPIGGNGRAGRGDWFLAEACEAYESFLDLRPEIALITNIEPDHLDHHGTLEHLRDSFARFLAQVPTEGAVVLCADRPDLRTLPLPAGRRAIWYGADVSAEVRGVEAASVGLSAWCRLIVSGRDEGLLTISAPGVHNVSNALGAVAACRAAGIPVEVSVRALKSFTGVGRRFEVLGDASGVTVVDDYAHHPTEIAATISAARSAFPGRPIVAIFQPHLYSRTRDFAEGFAEALQAADRAVLTDIYPAREEPIPGVNSGLIADHLRGLVPEDAVLEVAKDQIATNSPTLLRQGDVALCMGAGDIGLVARDLLSVLRAAAGRGRTASKQLRQGSKP
ncbi:MAG: UDP-N-acetylmuramate--L-alanine ligase [Armatimonadota bacterium]